MRSANNMHRVDKLFGCRFHWRGREGAHIEDALSSFFLAG